MTTVDIDDVKAAIRGRGRDVLQAVGGFSADDLEPGHRGCPMCKQGKDCFRPFNDIDDTGGVYCNKCHDTDNGDAFAAIQKMTGKPFPEVLQAVADYLNVKPRTKPASELRSQFIEHGSSTEAALQRIDESFQYHAEAKPPITADAIKATGGLLVTWPASNQYGQPCIAFPALMRPGQETGFILRRVDGKNFAPSGKLQERKTHMLRGSADGWVIPGGFERLQRATTVWRVEGVPDALALFPILPDDHAVITNICGAKACPENRGIFAGKTVYSVGDADHPGADGAGRFASKMLGIADTVKVIELPYDIEPDHGKDLRDFLNDGGTFADLQAIANEASQYEKPKRGSKSQPAESFFRPDREPVDPWIDIGISQGRTEIANSRRFLERHKSKVRYCHPWAKWLIWAGTHWQIDDSGGVLRLGKEVADSLWMEVASIPTDDAAKFAIESSKASKIASFLKLAGADVPVDVSELDAHPWLFNCANGTIDLRTGELRPHRQEDSLTKICRTVYNPDASSYHFDRFMESTFGNQTLIDFLQRLAGYCLSGMVSEQVLPVFWGSGSNGKSTLLTALQDVIGTDYSSAAPSSLLMEKKQESHPTELADLHGRRLVIAAETNSGARLAESTVKQLTGGDIISARRMREDFWTFTPTHKLILCTNHKPTVRGTEHAIWRRLVLVPFERTFWNPAKGETGPEELRQDKSLPEKLKAESEGILAWMVRGCLEWQRGGLQIPEIVQVATSEYRSESDTVGRFITQCCVTGDKNVFKVKFSSLYERLEDWCNDTGDNLPSRRFVGQYLQEKGYPDKQSGARWYLGIAINDLYTGDCVDADYSRTQFV